MNKTFLFSLLLLVAGGAVLVIPSSGPQPDNGTSPPPSPSISISIDDPGDLAAIKFLALYADGIAREAPKFAERIRNNPTTKEFAGNGPMAEAWREIAQDVTRASQQGLSAKISDIQDKELGYAAAADYLDQAGKGWRAAADSLIKLTGSR
jgi:hypothetical protein